ncbi:MAG: HD domain-containing protein [Oscillospiraceae bacterium]|nr:HD domain-containing protein [Oscillospiraceae bacterium]
MDKEKYIAIESYMQSCTEDSAHDKEHIYRVLNNALLIAETEDGVDYDVLITACLLHDVGRVDQMRDATLCHAIVGSEKAKQFLHTQGYSNNFVDAVSDCIRTHRFRKNAPPQTLEAKILFDADKLDVVGAMGIARTLAYQGAKGAPLYTKLPDGTVGDGSGDVPYSFFREYKFKLENLYDRFYTKKGRKVALECREAAVSFYEDLLREVRHAHECADERLRRHVR